eukprot:g10368.t1
MSCVRSFLTVSSSQPVLWRLTLTLPSHPQSAVQLQLNPSRRDAKEFQLKRYQTLQRARRKLRVVLRWMDKTPKKDKDGTGEERLATNQALERGYG